MPTLHMFGTSAGFINPERNPSAYLIETEQSDILLDCGDGISRTLAQRGYDWSRLGTILISHTHADHCGGLPMLVQQLFVFGRVAGRTAPLAIHAPREYTSGLIELLRMHYLFVETFPFECTIHELESRQLISAHGITIRPQPTTHLERAREYVTEQHYPNPCAAFSLSIEADNRKTLYSGDLGDFDDIRSLLPGCQAAILDSSHIDLDLVLEWAEENSGTRLYVSHIAPEFDVSKLERRIETRQLSNISLATDGLALEL